MNGLGRVAFIPPFEDFVLDFGVLLVAKDVLSVWNALSLLLVNGHRGGFLVLLFCLGALDIVVCWLGLGDVGVEGHGVGSAECGTAKNSNRRQFAGNGVAKELVYDADAKRMMRYDARTPGLCRNEECEKTGFDIAPPGVPDLKGKAEVG